MQTKTRRFRFCDLEPPEPPPPSAPPLLGSTMEKVEKKPAGGESDSMSLVVEPLALEAELAYAYEGSRR